MIPPYYCPTCDRYDRRRHDHKIGPVLVAIGLSSFVAMMILLVFYVLGMIP